MSGRPKADMCSRRRGERTGGDLVLSRFGGIDVVTLIPPGKMQEFRDAIVEGQEPRDGLRGSFYVRSPIQ